MNANIIISKITFNRNRLFLLCGVIICIFLILGLRLIYLQIICADQLISEGNKRSLRVQKIDEIRGMITDRMGRILAVSIPSYSVWIDPKKINSIGCVFENLHKWSELSNILNISLEKLFLYIRNHNTEGFLYLSRKVEPNVAEHISQLRLPGVYLKFELKRFYPAGSETAHLVGITDIDNWGIEGIEKSFNSYLSGQPKIKMVRKDRFGRVVDNISVLNTGKTSRDLMLSIDLRLQHLAYHALDNAVNKHQAESGSVVLIDIETGEILVMVNSPSYDPNNFATVSQSIIRNRCITDVFEPGSTVKPIVVITALQNKIIEEDTILETLPYVVDGYWIKDVVNHDFLTIREVLQKSSNVGVSKLALSMSIVDLVDAYLSFGIGKETNVGLIGENKGKIYSYSRYDSKIDQATLSYGYGIMVTALQLAKIYAIIGGMGMVRPLSIIRINDSDLSIDFKENQIFSKSLMRTIVNMMETTTLSSTRYHQSAIKGGYRVALKTGTIKKVGSNGKYINKYIACAAGVAPISSPKYALVVIINDPKKGNYYGSVVSVPIFKSIMHDVLKIMHVSPDCIE